MAKKASRVGRPPKDKAERRDKPRSVVFSDEELRVVDEAVRIQGVGVSEFIRSAVMKEARRVLGE